MYLLAPALLLRLVQGQSPDMAIPGQLCTAGVQQYTGALEMTIGAYTCRRLSQAPLILLDMWCTAGAQTWCMRCLLACTSRCQMLPSWRLGPSRAGRCASWLQGHAIRLQGLEKSCWPLRIAVDPA